MIFVKSHLWGKNKVVKDIILENKDIYKISDKSYWKKNTLIINNTEK